MPYEVKRVSGGYKVKKKSDGKALSKKPLSKGKAEAQKTAVEISEANKKAISPAQMAKLREHTKNHKGGMRSKHMRNMLRFMREGDSFSVAHKKAVKLDSK